MKQLWVKAFVDSLREFESESWIFDSDKWTGFLVKVLKRTGERIGCYVQALDPLDSENSGEFLTIDALFFDKDAWLTGDYPPVLPVVAVELENESGLNKIKYCLWKLLALRVSIRVLICYQSDSDKVLMLRKRLEEYVLTNDLLDGDNGVFLVFIGDSENEKATWDVYYTVFEWRENRLQRLDAFKE